MFRRAALAIVLLTPGLAWASPRPAAPTVKSSKLAKPKKLSRYAPVELYQVNTKETILLRFQDDRGRPIKGWQKRFDRFMRCHQTGTVFKMDQRLAHMLYQTARHYEGKRIEVVSGYRHPKVARNPRSPHKQGVACDFRVPGVANAALRDWLRKTFDHAGVGYYPNSVFVHLDNRKKGPSAFWIDYAGPGQEALYSENPREDLRSGRADHVRTGTEGEDDMAQAGAATAAAQTQPRQALGQMRAPIEIKGGSDPFSD